jgi:hypothetical protein
MAAADDDMPTIWVWILKLGPDLLTWQPDQDQEDARLQLLHDSGVLAGVCRRLAATITTCSTSTRNLTSADEVARYPGPTRQPAVSRPVGRARRVCEQEKRAVVLGGLTAESWDGRLYDGI